MRITLIIIVALISSVAAVTIGLAQTPGPATSSPLATTATTTPASATSTPVEATPTLESSPAAAPANFTLSGRLVVDTNANGVEDPADEAPLLALLGLMPWSTADLILAPTPVVPPNVLLYSAPDGSFTFENIPADSYTLEIVWFGGFVTKGALSAEPTLWRAAFRVTGQGEIVAPGPLPTYWPGSLVPFVPDEPVLGAIPDPILLKKVTNPNIVTVPVFDAGPAGPPPTGRVDVVAALKRAQQPAAQLPATGGGADSGEGWRTYLLLGVAAAALLSLAALLVRRART